MSKIEPGTVIHGTMRPEDLIPAFLEEYRRLAHYGREAWGRPEGRHTYNLRILEGNAKMKWDTGEATPEEVMMWDLEDLFELLDEFAPEGHYFGAHEGDGSDYGFWPSEEED